ncbi:hypothetical protein N9355_06915 [Crocinitomicaceae bacterium]|nr:hypothetical protein [Crocinitomicaceae bacterium]
MKWIGERISFVEDKNRTTVVIEPMHSGWIRSAMSAWVFMWLTIGISIIINYNSLALDENQVVFIWVFLAFWGYYAIRVTRSWLWLMWGKELIKIDEVALTYKRSIRRYGKATPYLLENIQKMRVSTPKENSVQAAWEKSPWIVGGERMEFDYMGRLVKFGRKLNKKDSELLFRYLTKRVEQQIRQSRKNQAKAEKV